MGQINSSYTNIGGMIEKIESDVNPMINGEGNDEKDYEWMFHGMNPVGIDTYFF